MRASTFHTVLMIVAAATRAHGQSPPTAADVNKNIQVFKTLPADQLLPAMQFMAGSLGVDCSHCHVTATDRPWPMDRDDKPAKLLARRMLTMVEQINSTRFGGRQVVTCATCHHGAIRPSSEVPLFRPPAVVTASVTSPAVAQILDRFVDAIGGREANARVMSRAYRGTITAADGRPLQLEVLEAAPDKLHATITRTDGTVVQGVDGESVWTVTPRGAVIEPDAAEGTRLRRLASFHKNEALQALDPDLAVVGHETINGRDTFRLEGRLGPQQVERLFFDLETGLLVRRIVLSETALGQLPEQTDYEDYRAIDGVTVAFVVRRTTVDSVSTQRYETVRMNVPVDADAFRRPRAR